MYLKASRTKTKLYYRTTGATRHLFYRQIGTNMSCPVFGETCIMEVALAHAHNVVFVGLQLTNVLQGMIAVCTALF